MITREERLTIDPQFPFSLLADREHLIFYDIETTGLSPQKAAMYLIGAVTFENGAWLLRQFFAENVLEEPELLDAFFRIIRAKKKLGRVVLVSYNGDGFDLPFMKNCIRQYGLPHDFTGTLSVDLMKKIRPYRKLAGLSDCKLKTVERLCGICREDRYNGGELIYVYEEYLRLANLFPESIENTDLNQKLKQRLLETLLLHNAEDIADMPMILPILGYEALAAGAFTVTQSTMDLEQGIWDIRAQLTCPLPSGIYRESETMVLSISEEDPYLFNLAVTLYSGELKYFFTDYKNYYYLPAEDLAIHKSVGEFVDRKARKQATARTCYQRRSGWFIPQFEAVFAPMFYRGYKELPAYGEIPKNIDGNNNLIDIDITKRYIMSVIGNIL